MTIPLPTTYVYTRNDGVRCHVNAFGPAIGDEHEHPDEPNWKPPEDWPYEWMDLDEHKENERPRKREK